MRTILKLRLMGAFLAVLLLCSCKTTPEPSRITPASELPADVTINKEAGRGLWVFVTIRLESGEELPFGVDTGSSWTILDKSLEPKLGKLLGTMTVPTIDGKKEFRRYAAPGLYLGNTRLMTGKNIYTTDHLKQASADSGQSVMGLLGVDCLQHYCIQMDFEAGRMRFLEPSQVNAADLGEAFPLAFKYLPFIYHTGPVAGKGTNWWLIDTGCNIDGLLAAPVFEPEVRKTSNLSISTNRAAAPSTNLRESLWFPTSVWSDNTYTNLCIGHGGGLNGLNLIGLRFLARHLVTFDFPKRTMYLKRTSIGPLVGDSLEEKVNRETRPAAEYLETLKQQGQLPGWPKNETAQLFCIYHPQGDSNSYTFAFRENGESSTRHYRVTRSSADSPWKLQKSWSTDQSDHTTKEGPVP